MNSNIDWVRKLSSRKLWAAAAGFVSGLAIVFALDQSIITTVSGATVSGASLVAYILSEGRIDAASAKATVEAVLEAIKAIDPDLLNKLLDKLNIKSLPEVNEK